MRKSRSSRQKGSSIVDSLNDRIKNLENLVNDINAATKQIRDPRIKQPITKLNFLLKLQLFIFDL